MLSPPICFLISKWHIQIIVPNFLDKNISLHTHFSILLSSKPQCLSLIMVQLLLGPSYTFIKLSLESAEYLPFLGPSAYHFVWTTARTSRLLFLPFLFFPSTPSLNHEICLLKSCTGPRDFRGKKVYVYSKFSTSCH